MHPHLTTSTDDGDELIDARQAADQEFHGLVSARTIDSWRTLARAQPLPFVVLGKRRLYRRKDVRAYLAARTPARSPTK